MSYVSLYDWSLGKLGKFTSFQILQLPFGLSWEKKSSDSKLVKPREFVKESPGLKGPNVFRGSKFQPTLRTQILLEFFFWGGGVKEQNEELKGIHLFGKQVFSSFYLVG